jgi:hypothetical protein
VRSANQQIHERVVAKAAAPQAPLPHSKAPLSSPHSDPLFSVTFPLRSFNFQSPRLSTREFRFEAAQGVVLRPLFGFDLGLFALKNQFVLRT